MDPKAAGVKFDQFVNSIRRSVSLPGGKCRVSDSQEIPCHRHDFVCVEAITKSVARTNPVRVSEALRAVAVLIRKKRAHQGWAEARSEHVVFVNEAQQKRAKEDVHC